jgi:hypothetical protein
VAGGGHVSASVNLQRLRVLLLRPRLLTDRIIHSIAGAVPLWH